MKKTFWPRNLKSKFEPISFEEGSTWCICMSYIDKLRNIEEIMHIKWKWPFDSCDPKWPQVDLWPHNIGRGSQANVHVWIVRSCYIQRTSYSTFSWKWPFDPCDPKWPQWFFRLITLIQGIWLMHMHESHGPFHVICRSYSTFSENDLFTPVTPNDPGWIFRPITFVEGI